MTMFAIASGVVLAAGWRRRALAFVTGAVGALAMAPLDIVPAMLVAMVAALWLVDGSARPERGVGAFLRWRSALAAASAGWWWGFGYFVAGLWWLGAACLVEPDKFLWALPFSVLGVPVILAVFPALGFALARVLWSPGPARVLALGFGLGASEWLRGWVLTGFPWNAYGMAFGDTLLFGQAASLGGIGLLTLLAVVIFAAPGTLADRAGRLARVVPTAAAGLALVLLAGYGATRLKHPVGDVPNVRLRILQPDLPQDSSFSYENRTKILDGYLSLSNRVTPDGKGLKDATHLIWPESAFPFILSREPDALGAIGEALPEGTMLVTGAARMERQPSATLGGLGRAHYFNAVQVVGAGGTILDSYDKVHLVPFGEYLPIDGLLRSLGLTNFVHVPGGFDAGPRRRLLDVPGLPPVAPAICYEAIFSGDVLPDGPGGSRAGVILNVTNDGWFGQTSGPYQHFAMARLRAIEEGLPLIRAANSGISAIVDPYGRVRASLPLGATDVLDGALPQRIAPPLFARHGPAVQAALYGFLFLASLAGRLLDQRTFRRVRP